jgi:hypothetical protein
MDIHHATTPRYSTIRATSNEIGQDRTPIDVFPVWTRVRMRELRAEASMIRHLFVLALTLAVLPAVAFAQEGGAQGHLGTPEQAVGMF